MKKIVQFFLVTLSFYTIVRIVILSGKLKGDQDRYLDVLKEDQDRYPDVSLYPVNSFESGEDVKYSPAHITWNQQVVAAGTIWAILISGGSGWKDYSLQADICHAYQVLKKGGIDDEHIIVFMKDDIAYHDENPEPGIIRAFPAGPNVYKGVPKDYVGENFTVDSIMGVFIDEDYYTAFGSGKMLKSNPNDRIFVYIASHGSGHDIMIDRDILSKHQLFEFLNETHTNQRYKSMVIYMTACFSGSMFASYSSLYDLLNIYIVASSDVNEYSEALPITRIQKTALSSKFGLAWMIDSMIYNREMRTLQDQYDEVWKKLVVDGWSRRSHPQQYGAKHIATEPLSSYLGFNKQLSPHPDFDRHILV